MTATCCFGRKLRCIRIRTPWALTFSVTVLSLSPGASTGYTSTLKVLKIRFSDRPFDMVHLAPGSYAFGWPSHCWVVATFRAAPFCPYLGLTLQPFVVKTALATSLVHTHKLRLSGRQHHPAKSAILLRKIMLFFGCHGIYGAPRSLSPDKSGGFNESTQHSARTYLALKTKAKIAG